jgi:hypothetical protein
METCKTPSPMVHLFRKNVRCLWVGLPEMTGRDEPMGTLGGYSMAILVLVTYAVKYPIGYWRPRRSIYAVVFYRKSASRSPASLLCCAILEGHVSDQPCQEL